MNDKTNALDSINANMKLIRKLTEKSRKLTEKSETLRSLQNNSAIEASRSAQDIHKIYKNLVEGIEIIPDALKDEKLDRLEKVHRGIPSLGTQKNDDRNRAEIKEDFETEILKIDQDTIELLIVTWEEIQDNEEVTLDEVSGLKEDTINTLIKYQRTINTFKELNSDLAVRLDYKKNELKFITLADWKSKFRLFFFRILWTLLFVSSLFTVGYIEQEYEWAHLPMSKYFSIQNER